MNSTNGSLKQPLNHPLVPPDAAPLHFTYKNWRGEVRARSAYPVSVRYGTSEWHKEPQYLLLAVDAETGEEREFAMKDMAPWGSLVGDNWGLE